MTKCSGPMGPAIKTLIEQREKLSRKWKSISNGKGDIKLGDPRGIICCILRRQNMYKWIVAN